MSPATKTIVHDFQAAIVALATIGLPFIRWMGGNHTRPVVDLSRQTAPSGA